MKVKTLYHKHCYWKKRYDRALSYLVTDYMRVSSHIKYNTNKWCGHDKVWINRLLAIVYGCANRTKPHLLFEVECEYDTETRYDEITKAVIRAEWNEIKDVTVVIRKGIIVTAWLQDKDDKHHTLDDSKYFKPRYKNNFNKIYG